MARMLGTLDQPPCKKHCGWSNKLDNQKAKRRWKRREKAQLHRELVAGAA